MMGKQLCLTFLRFALVTPMLSLTTFAQEKPQEKIMKLLRRNQGPACLCAMVLILGMAWAPTAKSQGAVSTEQSENSSTADENWHVAVAPYLWFPAINGTLGVRGYEASTHVSASDVLSNFNFGLMGAMEVRRKRFLIPVDFMWVKLSDNKGIPIGETAESVHIKINEDLFTPALGYRVVDANRFKMDVAMGVRYWHLGTTLTLQPTQIGNGHYNGLNWVDGVQGARFTTFLTRNATVTIAGDAGGGGARLDYQVIGLIGYRIKRVTLAGGWRYLVIHKSPTNQSFVDLGMTGVILGLVIPLK